MHSLDEISSPYLVPATETPINALKTNYSFYLEQEQIIITEHQRALWSSRENKAQMLQEICVLSK